MRLSHTRDVRRALLPAAILFLVSIMMPSPQIAAAQQVQRFEVKLQRSAALSYLLFLPEAYDARNASRWPLIVFLHGAGERGENLEKVTVHGPPKLVKTRPDFPFVVVSPQCPEGKTWEVDVLDALLGDVLAKHVVDSKRVYLTGLSMGGFGSWGWAAAHPDRFAAVAPICGGGDPIQVQLASGARRDALAKLPVWAFHGAKDAVVPLADSERMADAFKRIGNKPKLTVYHDAGHDSWTQTYANQELYDWFLQQRRP